MKFAHDGSWPDNCFLGLRFPLIYITCTFVVATPYLLEFEQLFVMNASTFMNMAHTMAASRLIKIDST